MALRRMEIKELFVVCEWDTETGHSAVALGGEREIAWARLSALTRSLHVGTGATWVDEEMRERILLETRACIGVGAAVYWRATFTPPGGAWLVPWAIAKAAGVEMRLDELPGV